MKQEKNNKGVVALLVVIIVFLLALVILLATGTVSFRFNSVDNNQNSNGITDNNNLITNNEAESILKNLYNDAVRHIYNEGVSYCGTYATGDNVTLSLNGFSYTKSATFNNFAELENYLKGYMTDSLLASSNYNKSTTFEGTTINSYYEKDGSLYCNGWNKGGNMSLANYLVNESTFTASNITENSFDGVINAVYSDFDNNNKTTKSIKVSVVKENNSWLLNTYEEL
jgi:hypothetical protein